MMKHTTFAIALAAATALSGAAMAAGSGDKAYQTQQGAQVDGAQMQQGARMEQGSGAAMGQSAGMSGENLDSDQIRDIQQALKDAGHDVNVDGIWGDNTAEALYEYQRDQGLQASGELDAQTVAELGVEIDGMGAMRPQQAQTPEEGGMIGGETGAGAEIEAETGAETGTITD